MCPGRAPGQSDDGTTRVRLPVRRAECDERRHNGSVENLGGIVLDPSGPRIVLGDLAVGTTGDAPIGGHDETRRARRSLIDGSTWVMLAPPRPREPSAQSRTAGDGRRGR
jgi:hypothetical protein